MKTKNLILALVAIVFAVGSAFTSKNANLVNDVFIKRQLVQNGAWDCVKIPRQCTNTGTITCTVAIVTSGFGTKSTPAHDNDNCTTVLEQTGDMPATYDFGATDPYNVE